MSLAPHATPLNLVALTKSNFKEKSDCVQPNEIVMLESTIFVYFLLVLTNFVTCIRVQHLILHAFSPSKNPL